MRNELTDQQCEELSALAEINLALGRKSFIMRSHWNEGYASLVRRGLVRWSSPPKGFDARRFAGTKITAKGRAALRQTAIPDNSLTKPDDMGFQDESKT